jgi:DNA helicase II / ATP-dependent DNA helicase PcrA
MKSISQDQLSEGQVAATNFGVATNSSARNTLLVSGPPGTGKSTALVHRCVSLINSGVSAKKIAVLAASKTAADELKRQVRILPSTSGDARSKSPPWAGTISALGWRIVSKHRELAQEDDDDLTPPFTLLSHSDAVSRMEAVSKRFGHTAANFPGKPWCSAIYSNTAQSQKPLSEMLTLRYPQHAHWGAELIELFTLYDADKEMNNTFDLDDLMEQWNQLVQPDAPVSTVARRFNHILVDDAQTLTTLQWSILKGMTLAGVKLSVFGDTARSTTELNSVGRTLVDVVQSHFGRRATVVSLVSNYRSTPAVLAAATAVINLAPGTKQMSLAVNRRGTVKPRLVGVIDELRQAQFIATELMEGRNDGQKLTRKAVLFRTASQAKLLELELARCGIPFTMIGGATLTDAAHIKDAIALLAWANNPKNRVAAMTALMSLQGIGEVTAGALLGWLSSPNRNDHLFPVKPHLASFKAARGICDLMCALVDKKYNWPEEISAVCRWFEPYSGKTTRDFADVLAIPQDLAQLQQVAATYKSRQDFLVGIALSPPEKHVVATASGSSNDFVTLSTFDNCCGSDYSAVYILNVVDGYVPVAAAQTDSDIEAERRRLFVAMNRAKSKLTLIQPWQRAHSPDHEGEMLARSRFLPDSVLCHFERSSTRA